MSECEGQAKNSSIGADQMAEDGGTTVSTLSDFSSAGAALGTDTDSDLDSLSMGQSAKQPLTFYALYIYENDRLSLVASNLAAATETTLSSVLLEKLDKERMISARNELRSLTFSLENSTMNGACYSQLLWLPEATVPEEGNGSDYQFVTYQQHPFVVCLVGPSDSVFDLFYPEVSHFCSYLVPSLHTVLMEDQSAAVTSRLEEWYSRAIDYVKRCISLLKEDVAILLHAALCNEKVEIVTDNLDTKEDVERFIAACSLSSMLHVSCQEVNQASTLKTCRTTASPVRKITVEPNTVEFSDRECSPYCKGWAQKLLAYTSGKSQALRETIESFRLKTIQDLNTLKQMVKKAETDHYALYRTYQFLGKCGYYSILLHLLGCEGSLASIPSACDVITLLHEFGDENGQAKLKI